MIYLFSIVFLALVLFYSIVIHIIVWSYFMGIMIEYKTIKDISSNRDMSRIIDYKSEIIQIYRSEVKTFTYTPILIKKWFYKKTVNVLKSI